MEPLVAVMMLVGCSADNASCAEIPVPVPFYASAEACRADLGYQMRFSGTADDRVLGTCAEVDPQLLQQSATVEWAVTRAGALSVEVVPGEPALASIDVASADAVLTR